MLIAVGIVTLALLVASGTGSADATRVIQFKGHGTKALPNFRVSAASTMVWTNSGSFFRISSEGGYCNEGSVASELHRGTSYIPSGRYQDMRVAAVGDWTITIRTGVEPVGDPITFSGSGGKAIPPFRLSSRKTLYWTNTGSIFQMYPADRARVGIISSEQHHGKTHLPAGRYRFFVSATAPEEPMGHWRIVIR
jgi:hypothetical protein